MTSLVLNNWVLVLWASNLHHYFWRTILHLTKQQRAETAKSTNNENWKQTGQVHGYIAGMKTSFIPLMSTPLRR